ncbi:carboxylate-amine ligase [Ahrensia sp. R2A130]|uniref:carboxylate-amine ligase n=1 Tax=Ahrensia sp. R2A130 TaxID=744979 RepID=UPI0001E0ACC5|nr:carboxylate-amine ligase [Ahrensia sp. R2A130]EFL88692.1 carboxylate-amine ligase [Ahrensia sp. R2A130]
MSDENEPVFSYGIEEEYLLVDVETRDLVREVPDALLTACGEQLGEGVTREYLRCQVEIGTKVCTTPQQARDDLTRCRRAVVDTARDHGMAPIAASIHPFANWRDQARTDRERYRELEQEHRSVAERMLICGMHVHIGIDDPEHRIDTMNQLSYFLPHLLALTTSSPFWEGHDTGLASHRLTVFDAMPRTGLPPQFDSWAAYRNSVDALVEAGVLDDATKIWWDMRPSDKYPTIEIRICDVCPKVDDALAVASLIRCLARMIHRLRQHNQRWRQYDRFLVDENRWRAQRYGVGNGLMDIGIRKLVPFADLVDEMIELVAEDAAFFGCKSEIGHLRNIVQGGTSADRQRATFENSQGGDEGLRAVVDALVDETRTL